MAEGSDTVLDGARILVTGATGFLGRHLVARMAALGHRPTLMLRPGAAAPEGFAVVRATLGDPASLQAAVRDSRPEVLFHLAACTDPSRDAALDAPMIAANLTSTVMLARSAQSLGVRRFVFAGTCEEYGRQMPPFAETMAPAPLSPYSASKAAAGLWLRMLHQTDGFPVVILRPFLIYGPGQRPPKLVPSACLAALRDEDFPMTAGRQMRELTFVGDAVEGLLRAASTPEAVGRTINLGSGVEFAVVDIVERIFRLAGGRGRPLVGARPERPNDMQHFCADTRLAEQLLGWRAVTSLDDGLHQTLDWTRRHGDTPVSLGTA